MLIRDLPQDIDAFERFNRDYEASSRRTEASCAVAAATREMFAG